MLLWSFKKHKQPISNLSHPYTIFSRPAEIYIHNKTTPFNSLYTTELHDEFKMRNAEATLSMNNTSFIIQNNPCWHCR